MKYTPLALLLATAAPSSASSAPHRMSHASLKSAPPASTTPLVDALHATGLVAVTSVEGLSESKAGMLSSLPGCIADVESSPSVKVATAVLPDGTVRKSFASTAGPDGAMSSIRTVEDYLSSAGKVSSPSCEAFSSYADSFRAAVGRATSDFAGRLSSELGGSLPVPLVTASSGRAYATVSDVVSGGTHLEHFHSYSKPVAGGEGGETIELHTDQGLFIAFTPGLVVGSSEGEGAGLSGGFHVRDAEGRSTTVNFDEEDDLVFMIGDGANSLINERLGDKDGSKVLRATPHALSLPASDGARVWYGRMVLSPADLDGDRQALIERVRNGGAAKGVGCSGPDMTAIINTARELQEGNDGHDYSGNGCAEDEMYCWFRCQKLSDFGFAEGLTPENACLVSESKKLRFLEGNESDAGVATLKCANPRMQVHPTGKGHGDYYPVCTTNTAETHPVTPYPAIEQQDEEVCDLASWEAFSNQGDYEHKVDLTQPDTKNFDGSILEGAETHLLYTVKDGKLHGRIVSDQVFGWLAFGLGNIGGKHNGMNGANVILAAPGPHETYSAATGLEVTDSQDPSTGSVAGYKIHEADSSFRHWAVPVSPDLADASFSFDGCYTDLTFEVDAINGKGFHFDGVDTLIWGANSEDYFVGYHGRTNRMIFDLDWGTGEILARSIDVTGEALADVEVVEADAEKEEHDHSGHKTDGEVEVPAGAEPMKIEEESAASSKVSIVGLVAAGAAVFLH